jgi:two-component system, NarL family, response regulator NreC
VRALLRTIVSGRIDAVFERSRGEDAEAAVDAHRPDLVLMDLEMPAGLDGVAAACALRIRFLSVRVTIITQHDAIDLRDAAAQAGACAYVLHCPFASTRC